MKTINTNNNSSNKKRKSLSLRLEYTEITWSNVECVKKLRSLIRIKIRKKLKFKLMKEMFNFAMTAR